MLNYRGKLNCKKMEANKAREISETFDNSLKSILFSIKCMAESGHIEATFTRKDRVIREKELSELQKRGYKILKDDDEYVVIGW